MSTRTASAVSPNPASDRRPSAHRHVRLSRNIPQQPPAPGSRGHAAVPRLLALKIAFFCGFVIVGARLVHIQLINAPRYQELARRQYESETPLPAMRGVIYDRNGAVFTSNTMAVSFGADPMMIGARATALADRCARVFGKPARSYLETLRTRGRHFVWLERRVPAETARRITVAEFPGLVVVDEPRRLYNNNRLAGQVVGFTSIDNVGLSGIELQYNALLRGVNGRTVMQRDGRGALHPSVDYPTIEPVNGNNVILTLDLGMQGIAEQELRNGMERTRATSGLVVMLDPRTGEVLAMANFPGFDPNTSSTATAAAMKNRTITDQFEPGSVFKVVTASAALEHDLVTTEQQFFAEHGTYVVRGRQKPITDTHEYGMLTFRQAVELSSNIVMAKVSDKIGAEIFYTTAREYGFGIPTGVGLPGEVAGDLKKPTEWSGTSLNSMAYGYEVGVTPIQIAAAYAAVANRGILLRPWILKEVVSPDGEVLMEGKPQVIRRAISVETAAEMTTLLEGVVQRGTGVSAQVDGLSIAGKTGTSRKVIEGRYERSYTASFVGFFPSRDPQVVCLVMLDEPVTGGYTGGQASAPIFRGIAARVNAMSDRFQPKPATVIAGRTPVVVPEITNLHPSVAGSILESHGFDVEQSGEGDVVLAQSPVSGSKVRPGSAVRLTVVRGGTAAKAGVVPVPDVRGLAIRRAVNRLTVAGLDVSVEGSGVVTAQSPAAGQNVVPGSCIVLRCSPGASALAVRH
jgi:cell division protein FtsI/penicillin-binding protein 2